MPTDTIAAIATATAPAGIGAIRISGPEAAQVADRVFSAVNGVSLAELSGYRAAFGKVSDADGLIDEAVALRFVAPHSYTGEDVVELFCHGGTYLLRRALRAVLANGARMANAGEFTRRAFENGKLDLTAAESVMDLIGAESQQAHQAALSAKNGATFAGVESIRDQLVQVASSLAAWVDFPDEDVPEVDDRDLLSALQDAEMSLDRLQRTADQGRILREGIEVAIVGKPNVGKSTVMNLLARCDRSIVTDLPGTTRDAIEERVSVGGVPLRLTDTAGIRDTEDPVEAIGVSISRQRLESAGLILAVFDRSRPLDSEDAELLSLIKGRKCVILLNKADLDPAFDQSQLPNGLTAVTLSAKFDPADRLEDAITEAVGLGQLDLSAGIIANERQLGCVMRAKQAVSDAIGAIEGSMTLDAVGVCIDDALAALCELTGERVSEQVVEDVFRRFCVGK